MNEINKISILILKIKLINTENIKKEDGSTSN